MTNIVVIGGQAVRNLVDERPVHQSTASYYETTTFYLGP
jgi:hypothetical protein